MELSQMSGLAIMLFVTGALARAETGFLVTAPQQFVTESTEKVCATFYNLLEKSLVIRIQRSSTILAEVSAKPTEDDVCLDVTVPTIPSSSIYERPQEIVRVLLEVEVAGRTIDGIPFLDTQQKDINLSSANKIQTYIQTDKPIYKAGQTVKFRILSLEYPDLKPHIQKIRRIYVEEPGGRRVQQWSNVDTRVGLADLEMPLSPEPPLGIWTIFAAVGSKKVRQTFEVGEYVLPKFEVKIVPQPSYVYKRAQEINVKICGSKYAKSLYSYGEPVRGGIEANFSLSTTYRFNSLPLPEITRLIEDTGSDGCHTFQIDSSLLNMKQIFSRYNYYSYKLHVDAAFTEHGTDVTMVESGDVADLTDELYSLVIEGPDTFKPGLPYHGVVHLTYPDKYPVSNKNVKVELRNYEGGDRFKDSVIVSISNGVGKFILTSPRSAVNTKLKISAKVTAHENEEFAKDIRSDKYLQAWFSPSGNFLTVAPMSGGKQSGQKDNIEVDFTVPSDQSTVTFHYKIMSRGNIVHSGQQRWTDSPIVETPTETRPDQPSIPVVNKPNIELLPIPRGQFETDAGRDVRPYAKEARPRAKRGMGSSSYGGSRIVEPPLPTYHFTDVAHVNLPFNVSSYMGPKSKVLVYYILPDGEIVSGSAEFTVTNIFANQVSLDFTNPEALPGAAMRLTVNASPQSLCALGVVDKSVHLLRDSNQLTAQKVQDPLQSFNTLTVLNPSSQCTGSYTEEGPHTGPLPRPQPGRPGLSPDRPRWRRDVEGGAVKRETSSQPTRRTRTSLFSRHIDAAKAFENAGMIVLTNLDVENKPCYKRISEIYPYYYMHGPMGQPGPTIARGGGPLRGPMAKQPMARQPMPYMPDMVDYNIVLDTMSLDIDDMAPQSTSPLVEIRSYFPETWLWLLTVTDESGSASIDSEVPHTITEWVANGFCTSTDNGFGIADPVELRAFQPFFLSYNLPYSAIREETIPIDVTVFNYLTDCFTVSNIGLPLPLKKTLPLSYNLLYSAIREETICIDVTVFNYLTDCFTVSNIGLFNLKDPLPLKKTPPLSYNLPYSAIRKEIICIDVTVFNYLTDCFTIELSIEQSSEFSLLDASPNKYVCVCDRESKTVNFTIIPREIGEIKVTVHGSYVTPGSNVPLCGNNVFLANVNGVRDAIEDTLLIEPEGVEREETFSEMVCLEEGGPDFNTVVPLSVPADVIQDSARGRIFISGDMMGSVLSNLDSILQMPTGCGEQNMIKFAPNIYVLEYLTSTNQLTRDIETKALEFLRIGYQRELTYRLNDGSYSAFGQSDGEGSTWLTAFVLKSFVQANMFIDIDTSDIIVTRNWLLRQQKKDTGCFEKRGVLRHQSMKGGVSDEVTLTAYVLVSLLEAGVNPDDTQVVHAEECITARLTEVYSDPYALALVTYALLLAENPDGRLGLQQLDTLAHTEAGGLMYWKRTDNEPMESDCIYCRPPSASVEMTSYALLAYLTSDDKDVADAMPIVRWMNQQRSALGGYSSTQDTVMGLQSLSQYASRVYSNDTNMAIDVVKTNTVPAAFLNRFVLNADNQILTQRMELDEVPTTLRFNARGKGCALVQAEIRYNVPAVRTIRRDPFEITLDMSPLDNVQHCGKKTLTTCIRYVGPRDATNMAAVEFKMVTGYSVDMESLGLYLQQHGQSIGLKRIDPPSKGNPLVLYFDYFDSTQRCFDVEVKQKIFVDSAKPASIKVYDYYEPGVKSYKDYNTCPPKDKNQQPKGKPKP
ncbi:LOW QUALITY PROTEIN: pregnancy zone protein-like [Amphiura filiformis]|uniref:LOW QUALITY PROTEIN: pregnancy zone protein-like n=1 Tax=Amphiura filiformis TaxID=82378 RepID=UPI003B21B8D6